MPTASRMRMWLILLKVLAVLQKQTIEFNWLKVWRAFGIKNREPDVCGLLLLGVVHHTEDVHVVRLHVHDLRQLLPELL